MAKQLNKLRHLSLAVCLVAVSSVVFAADIELATDTPAATIVTLQNGLIALSQQAPNATVEERYQALVPLIAATHDLPYIAEFALRRQWGSFSEPDRERFVTAFERLSVMTYAARFANVGPGTFREVQAQPVAESGRAEVATAIARADAPDVSLEYLLQQGGDGWRIINVIADGVSDLALKRAEYQRLLTSGSLDALIAELEAQTQRLMHR